MVELLKNIDEHKDKNDILVCYELCNYIIKNNIKSEEDLKEKEYKNFNTEDLNQINTIKYNEYLKDITHLENFDQNIISKLVQIEDEYESSTDELIKCKCIIKIYSLINWEFYFPYTAYKLIINDKLN